MTMPMFNNEEYKLCLNSLKFGKEIVENELVKRDIQDYVLLGEIPKGTERHRYFIDMYRVITGFDETNPNAIMHHRIEYFGADCPICSKSLRTPKAKYCVECGFGMEEVVDQTTSPLMERKKELFNRD